jgi:hypothetical protein
MTAQKEAPLPSRHNGIDTAMLSSVPHPLDPLSTAEFETARQCIISTRGDDVIIKFRAIIWKNLQSMNWFFFWKPNIQLG